MARLLILPLLLMSAHCGGIDPPEVGQKGPCNNNGTCEVDKREDSVSCPADCPPCQAFQVHVDGNLDPNALIALQKANDSKAISLSKGTSVRIEIGQAVYQSAGSTTDFSFQGTVTSNSTVALGPDNCVLTPPKGGGFLVQISKDGLVGSFTDVGYWAKTVQGGPGGSTAAGVATFSLCGFGGIARYIQVISQPGATGTLDYFKAHSCDP
jgi:hypothetical protein